MAHHVMTTTIYLRRLPLLLESLAPVFLINLTDLEFPHVGVSLLDLRNFISFLQYIYIYIYIYISYISTLWRTVYIHI